MRQVSELIRHKEPVTLPPHASVQQACTHMRDRRVGAVLVMEDDNLIGIFTARDAVGRVLANCRDPAATTLADVMTKNPTVLEAGSTAIEALRLMHDCGFRHVPVVRDGKLLGIVSKGDFSGLEHNTLEEETVLWERMA